MAFPKANTLRLNLALQGGGAHGAYTWGVLDELLTCDVLALDTVSGTSAGAVNAVAVASGLAQGGPERAREVLRGVWEAVVEAGRRDRTPLNPFAAGLRGMEMLAGGQFARLAGTMSPYEFNPLDINPLRTILTTHIDFPAVKDAPLSLAIAATDVETGLARIFERDEIDLDVVLASACLPAISQAVEIDGRYYWDGGFSANPDLLSFARLSRTQDTLLVLVSPLVQPGVPQRPQEIAGAMSRLTFNQPLMRDLWLIDAVRRARGLKLRAQSTIERLASHRFHLLDGGQHTGALPLDSKLVPDPEHVTTLYEAGCADARAWLDEKAQHVGWRETADFEALFGTTGTLNEPHGAVAVTPAAGKAS